MSTAQEKTTGCTFCTSLGHSWSLPEGGRICFECLRSQRDRYHDQCLRQVEEIRYLRAQTREHLPPPPDQAAIIERLGLLIDDVKEEWECLRGAP